MYTIYAIELQNVAVYEHEFFHVASMVIVQGYLHLVQSIRLSFLPWRVGVGSSPCNNFLELGAGQRIFIHESTNHWINWMIRAEAIGPPAVPALNGVGGGLPVG